MAPLRDRVRALRLAMLAVMATLTTTSTEREFRSARGRLRHFKRAVQDEAVGDDDPQDVISEVYSDPAFRSYERVRTARLHRGERYRQWAKAYDSERSGRPERKTPEARARLAAARKAQRLKKKEREKMIDLEQLFAADDYWREAILRWHGLEVVEAARDIFEATGHVAANAETPPPPRPIWWRRSA